MSVARKPLSDLLSISFNQDAGCFCCGLTSGFRVYNSEPLAESYRRDFEGGGVALVEMLFRCNILALVGGGPVPRYPPNKVMIWDDHQGRCIGELAFRTPVRAVRMRKDRVAVALEQKVLLYDLEDLRLVHPAEETAPNPKGLLALSASAESTVLAYPGQKAGQVRLDLLDTRRKRIIQAHASPLAALALSASGKLVATASEKGTLVRVFSTADGSRVRELRRGSDPARIYSLAFSRGERPDWLAVTSDKGTAHVFGLSGAAAAGGGGNGAGQGQGGAEAAGADVYGSSPGGTRPNSTSALSFVSKYVPAKVGGAYFSSERSFAQHRLPDAHRAVVAFGRDPATLLVASHTGAFHRLQFNPERGGTCEVLTSAHFMEGAGAEEDAGGGRLR